jgi:hypothetical protein
MVGVLGPNPSVDTKDEAAEYLRLYYFQKLSSHPLSSKII